MINNILYIYVKTEIANLTAKNPNRKRSNVGPLSLTNTNVPNNSSRSFNVVPRSLNAHTKNPLMNSGINTAVYMPQHQNMNNNTRNKILANANQIVKKELKIIIPKKTNK